MPKNNKNFAAKDIAGKKIREQYFDAVLIGLVIVVVGYTIWSLFDIENFVDSFINTIILITCFSPFVLLSILNKFCFGKILCVLAEDKLYYFNAETRINSRHKKTNGYVSYNEIENVVYIPATLGVGAKRFSRVIISGENFEITIWNANHSLVKQIHMKNKNHRFLGDFDMKTAD